MTPPGRPPGHPGIPPRWTSSAKSGVGRAAGDGNRVWFSISHGIVNEVYFPTVDQANIRDLALLVTDGTSFFSEEKRHTHHEIAPLAPGVPGYRLTNTCEQGRYRIEKVVVVDAGWDTLIQQVRFEPLRGALTGYRLYALLAPHIGNRGYGNHGWVGDYNGVPMLFAKRDQTALALGCSVPFGAMSSGYVGTSDGWQDISRHYCMTWFYPDAPDGNIALVGEIDPAEAGGRFTLALAFGRTADEAGQRARAALLHDERLVVQRFVEGWQSFQSRCLDLSPAEGDLPGLYRTSVAVLKTHTATHPPGGIIASLSIPWGFDKGDDDLGGYHLVWPRDLVESAGGLLAAGDTHGARDALFFLMCTQDPDGHWPQNMWLDGRAYWPGSQMDETALPILLADALRRSEALDDLQPWMMVRRAAGYLVRNGPVTQQDRWEEDGGYSPFTLAVEIAALLAAADFADAHGEPETAVYLRETADTWNDGIERWTYASGTELARQIGVEGYYVRIAPPDVAEAASPIAGYVPIKNRPPGQSTAAAREIVSPDALALVRFGLRAPNDPRITNTVRVIDALLQTETATGPVWHRYNGDGYGEHADGAAFDGTGIGRGWPVLTGERAHFELAAGRRDAAKRLRAVMAAQAGEGGMIPEQIWDAADIPYRELYNGRPAGSAMPLAWAHAEYIKVLRALRDGRVFDMPPQPVARYQRGQHLPMCETWQFNHKVRHLAPGRRLRLVLLAPARVRWTVDGWQTANDVTTRDTKLGVHVADLTTDNLPAGVTVAFTFFWTNTGNWEGTNFDVDVK